MTCQKPGTAATECGAGIASGAKLSFTMDYATGIQAFQEEVANYKSDASQAGIQLNLVPQSFDTIIGETTPCAVGPKCNWDMLNFGGWNFNGPGFEPTGEPLFATGASSNSGSYSNSNEDKLITGTHTSSSIAAFDAVRDVHRSAAAVHLDAERVHRAGNQQQAGRRGLQPARRLPPRVLVLHQV